MARPTKYEDKYCELIVEYFSVEPFKVREEHFYYKNGDEKVKEVEVANSLPFFSEFERKNGLGIGRCSKWAKVKDENGWYKYPEFRQAYKEAKELQKAMLINNGLKGLYSAPAFIFTAKNIAGMRDKFEQDITSGGEKINPIYAGQSIQGYQSNKKDIQSEEED